MARPFSSRSVCFAVGVMLVATAIGLYEFGLLAFIPHTPIGVGCALIVLGVVSLLTGKPVAFNELPRKPVTPPAPTPDGRSESN